MTTGTPTSTISWGRHERFKFTAYGALKECALPAVPAVFAVTYRRDPKNKPKGQTILLFGECEDLSIHLANMRHQVMEAWGKEGGSVDDLFVFVHAMPGSTKKDRTRVTETLILEYQPLANNAFA